MSSPPAPLGWVIWLIVIIAVVIIAIILIRELAGAIAILEPLVNQKAVPLSEVLTSSSF